jgi:hypothetical protein
MQDVERPKVPSPATTDLGLCLEHCTQSADAGSPTIQLHGTCVNLPSDNDHPETVEGSGSTRTLRCQWPLCRRSAEDTFHTFACERCSNLLGW